jgi:hypothetical protein
LILPLCYCPMCPIQWDRVQLNWTWFFFLAGKDLYKQLTSAQQTRPRHHSLMDPTVSWGTVGAQVVAAKPKGARGAFVEGV